MKKLIALMLAVLMLCTLAACDNNDNANTTTPAVPMEGFTFTYQGYDLVPGAAFEEAALGAAESFENPNCAGEGKFITYMHEAIELTVNVVNGKTVVYSVYVTDANTPTAEGLYLGDDLDRVTELYGIGQTSADGGTITYTKGTTKLVLVMEDRLVASIEYAIA